MFILNLFVLAALAPSPTSTPTWLLMKTGCQQLVGDEYANFNKQVEEGLVETCVSRDEGEPPFVRVFTCGRKGSYFWFWTKQKCEQAEKKLQVVPKGLTTEGA